MRKIRVVLCLCVFLLPSILMAAGGRDTDPSAAQSSSSVSVTIPGVVGIDVESDVAFNFSTGYALPSSTTVCNANEFPPSPACVGTNITYDPTITHVSGLPAPAPSTGAIWMAVFCSKSSGTLAINASVSSFANSPGFASTALRYMRANSTNIGPTSATNFATTPAVAIGNGALGATFGWTRADQKIDLMIPGNTAFTDANSPYAATITFEISKN